MTEREAFVSFRSYFFQSGVVNCRSSNVSFDMMRAIWIGATDLANAHIARGAWKSPVYVIAGI
jgi:hypothetical protein